MNWLFRVDPARAWTVESLAETATMSRSIFSDRFTAVVGMPPVQPHTPQRYIISPTEVSGHAIRRSLIGPRRTHHIVVHLWFVALPKGEQIRDRCI
jgi:hypothetical protein